MKSTYHDVFVAFFDILGFKELVTQNSHTHLVKIYDNLFEQMISHSFKPLLERKHYQSKVELISISDSFVLWTNDDTISGFHDILIAARNMMINSIILGIPLRGAISKGDITVSRTESKYSKFTQTHVLGNGIVRAYELEQSQQWAGCIIDKNCTFYIDKKAGVALNKYSSLEKYLSIEERKRDAKIYSIDNLLKNKWIFMYDVPFNNGQRKTECVVNWIQGFQDVISKEKIYNSFKEHNKKITHEKVKIKIENTIEFCKHVCGDRNFR